MEPTVIQQAYTSMMKFTIDGRPFMKDICDLFAALIVQTPLETHRYLFRNYCSTFTSEDAIQVLSNLKFSHTIYKNDPENPSRQQCTTTTTTFNMEREMAKSLCQQFQNCRLIENATDHHNRNFREKGIWSLTRKGISVLQDFCSRTDVDVSKLKKQFKDFESIHLIYLERDLDNDQLILNRASASVIFRILIHSLPIDNEFNNSGNTGSISVSHQSNNTPPASSNSSAISSSTSSIRSIAAPFSISSGISHFNSRSHSIESYLLTLSSSNPSNRSRSGKIIRAFFSSQMCCDWLQDFSTISSIDEAEAVVSEFLKNNWIEYQDPKHITQGLLRVSKTTMLIVTDKGKSVINDTQKSPTIRPLSQSNILKSNGYRSSNSSERERNHTNKDVVSENFDDFSNTTTKLSPDEINFEDIKLYSRHSSESYDVSALHTIDPRESNSDRLKIILENPKLRSPFKDFLRTNFCEENLDFWIDYSSLRRKYRNQSPALPSQNQKDLLEDAYNIWSTYLDSGSPCELNVDRSLCQEIARLVNSVVTVLPAYSGQSNSTIVVTTSSASQSLLTALRLFDRVNDHICRLMASDSVPKFVKTERYRRIMSTIERMKKTKDLDALGGSLRKMESKENFMSTF